MKPETEAEISDSKEKMANLCMRMLGNMCHPDLSQCAFPSCASHNQCYKKFYERFPLTIMPRVKIKSKLKNIKSHYTKFKGRKNPTNLGNSVMEIATTILGQNPIEHPLLAKNKQAIRRFRECTTIWQMVDLLKRIKNNSNEKR